MVQCAARTINREIPIAVTVVVLPVDRRVVKQPRQGTALADKPAVYYIGGQASQTISLAPPVSVLYCRAGAAKELLPLAVALSPRGCRLVAVASRQ